MDEARGAALRRRARTVPAVALAAVALTLGAPLVVPIAALADLVRLRRRLPTVRLLAFGICWAWLELAGVAAATGLWLVGRRRDLPRHYRLQRWWADRLVAALRRTCGVTIHVDGVAALDPTPTMVLARHASLADSLVTVWAIAAQGGHRPRVVLKKELLSDPCLDIVGQRLPNCFIDRGADDAAPSLAAIEALGAGMGPDDVAVIFPEGTRANPDKRRRALERIGAADPERAARLGGLRRLLPPRPGGTTALWRGARRAGAGVVLARHSGLDGMDTFAGILAALAGPPTTVRLHLERVDPPPDDAGAVQDWLDAQWLRMDQKVVEDLREG